MSDAAKEIIFAVEEASEGGYVARALGHDIFTEADTLDALRDTVRDAVRCHFDEDDRPRPSDSTSYGRKSLRHEGTAGPVGTGSRQGAAQARL